jgi:hypothetical protein
MDNLASEKQFESLLHAVEANPAGLGPLVGDNTALGPCVGSDVTKSPTVLGPCVGDDTGGVNPVAASLTTLGPCVGDDGGPSVVRLKEDVQRIGTTVFGLPLYHFKYLGRSETYEGVMAQDVLSVMPSAVSRGEDGYYRVNYSAWPVPGSIKTPNSVSSEPGTGHTNGSFIARALNLYCSPSRRGWGQNSLASCGAAGLRKLYGIY